MNQLTRLVFFIITIAVASAVSYVVYNKMTRPPVVFTKESSHNLKQIAVATRDIQRGVKIAAEDIRLSSFLEATAPQGHFDSVKAIVGRVVLTPISLTQPILESALAPETLAKGGMAAIIGKQKRAMAVKVDNVIGVAGFLQAGHLVDVLVAMDKPGGQKEQVSKTILENIPVLSVGTQTEVSEDKKKTSNVTVVTLEVDLDEGEKLSLAVNQGRIQLALRGYTDTSPVLTKGNTMDSLLKAYSSEIFEPVPISATTEEPVRVARERPRMVMEMMNGNSVKRITLDR